MIAEQTPSVGAQLRQAREEQGLTISELAITTRIKERYLAAIESDRFQILPSPIQQKGFVRSYAQALGLDPDALVAQLPSQQQAHQAVEPVVSQPAAQEASKTETDPGINALGKTIQMHRERLGYSLTNIEDQIYIPHRYLEAIENGELDLLPSPVHGRGMVKNYAEFLGLDPDPLLLQYAETLQERYQAERPQPTSKSMQLKLPVWVRRLFTGPKLTGLMIVFIVISALIGSILFVFGKADGDPDPTETIPGVAEVLLPSDTPLPTISPSPEGSDAIEVDITLTPGEEGGVIDGIPATSTINAITAKNIQVQLIILQRSWVRVEVDGKVAFEGRLLPGSVEMYNAEERIEVLTGNAGGVEVIYNQQDLGVLGLFGEVVSQVYTAEGIASPTPTISLTPTVTETSPPTITPTPSTISTEDTR